MAAAAVTAVAAGGAVATQTAHGAPARPDSATLKISASRTALKFNVSKLSASAGRVTIRMANPSNLPHGVAVSGRGVKKVGKIVTNGGTSTVTLSLKKGKYTFYCPVPGHEMAGMKGTLTIR